MRTLITGLILSLAVISSSFGVDMGEIPCGESNRREFLTPDQEDTWMYNGQAGNRI